jgi:hypothetical protein
MNNMKFKITQNYGKNGSGWIHFDSDSSNVEELKKLAAQEMRNDYNNKITSLYWFSGPPMALPTIEVVQINENGMKTKNGIQFKTKWR